MSPDADGSALASHAVKTGTRVGINASPEPFSNIVASLLEDLCVAGLVSFAVFHPVASAIVAAVVLAAGIAFFALLATRVRRGWHRRRDAQLQRRSSGGRVAGVPSPQQQDATLPACCCAPVAGHGSRFGCSRVPACTVTRHDRLPRHRPTCVLVGPSPARHTADPRPWRLVSNGFPCD